MENGCGELQDFEGAGSDRMGDGWDEQTQAQR
jgi:hypothetical protein